MSLWSNCSLPLSSANLTLLRTVLTLSPRPVLTIGAASLTLNGVEVYLSFSSLSILSFVSRSFCLAWPSPLPPWIVSIAGREMPHRFCFRRLSILLASSQSMTENSNSVPQLICTKWVIVCKNYAGPTCRSHSIMVQTGDCFPSAWMAIFLFCVWETQDNVVTLHPR
jgi:hypothetical protein